ncbi:hypothetical protein CAPTEDRAFT_166697 [Capitella teleta]|uniref:NAB co-repressor domain-containing protein n=1 Tax=Capitella teleta TaxID=283909 RepID=R7VI37_CAPTE|nr:hypothetical protein CAPTEDRAFT_166697 [Capitella teleta]|eukprot:ELU18269.1 hypothetical protein CAPTEDRAFT_166697 [Capitella teleta]
MSRSQPSSDSEIQLYQILQRANLLQYYDTFISQGGDDVQQLCEAGEEEFLEIMALVGMASKPLHVRRLQKALQEWALNPVNFQQSLGLQLETMAQGSILSSVQKRTTTVANFDLSNAVPASGVLPLWTSQAAPVVHTISPIEVLPSAQGGPPAAEIKNGGSVVPKASESTRSSSSCSNGSPSSAQGVRIGMTNEMLGEAQIKAIEMAASELGKTLPQFEMKLQNVKKHISKDIEAVIAYATQNLNNPEIIHLMRKYGAIYGRFDSKRKGEKRMTLHEVSVNEAAAQLCCCRPTLLTQREVLFPLARQVVRESGYQYSKGHSRAQSLEGSTPCKKAKIDFNALPISTRNTARLVEINQEISVICKKQELIKVQMELAKKEADMRVVHQLQNELEDFTSKQLLLLSERSDISSQQQQEITDLNNSKDLVKISDNSEDDDRSSCSSVEEGENKGKESLFDAGMRIAQAYGLGEFAQELKGLQVGDPPPSSPKKETLKMPDIPPPARKSPVAQIRVIEVDEQEEWNRAIEEDWKKRESSKSKAELS